MTANDPHRRAPSPGARFATLLGVVFAADLLARPVTEALVGGMDATQRVLESMLLALLIGAPVWWLVIRPLKVAARAERTRAATVVAHAGEGIVTVDGDGRVASFNPAAEAMFGLSDAEARGRAWTDLVPPPDRRVPEGCAVLLPRAGEDGRPVRVETEALRADGTAFAVELTASPLGPEPGAALACLVRDASERKAAEGALRESRAMLRLVLDAIPVRVFWKDLDSVYLGCNGSCARDAGLENPARIVGLTDFDLGWRELAEPYRADDREVITTGVPKIHYEEHLVRPDGTTMWVQTSKVPLTDSRGNVVGVMGCYADITERKRTEEALERTLAELEDRVRERTADLESANLRLTREVRQRRAMETRLRLFRGLLDGSNDGLFVVDAASGRLLDLNRAARTSLGYGRRALLGKAVWDIEATVPDLAAWRERVADLESGASTVGEGLHRRADGSTFPVEVNAALIRVDGARYIVAVVRDITARKEAETALLAAKEEAERASRAKSDFLSRISHELRTPMNAILGFAQLLQGSVAEPLGPEHRRFTGEILGAGNHLLTLVNEILDLTRIEAGMLDLEITSVSLPAAVAEAAGFLAPMALERRVTVTPGESGPFWVLADAMRLREVLLNLISNAIKYNREEGRVTVTCRAVPGRRVAVEVADTGPGIPPEQRERLFEPFDRLGMETSGVEGTGIGLAITRQLAAAMDGTVEMESTPGSGSRFTLILPTGPARAEAAEPERARPAPPERTDPGPRTVLYIEDNPTNMTLVQEIFRARPDMVLLSATRGHTGLDAAREAVPDLILLDVNLPDMDGFEVLQALRDQDATREIPVVGVSANSFAEDVTRARQAGFTDYVTKPFNVGAFLAAVDGALARGGPGWRGGPGSV